MTRNDKTCPNLFQTLKHSVLWKFLAFCAPATDNALRPLTLAFEAAKTRRKFVAGQVR